MTPLLKDFTVLQVVSGAPDAVIGINLGGDFGYVTLECTNAPYQPQLGDTVRIDMNSMPGQPFFHSCRTRGRLFVPPALGLTVSTSAPTSAAYVAAPTMYVSPTALWAVVAPTAAPTNGSRSFAPSSSDTWDPTNGWRHESLCRQGVYPGGSGPAKGLWFYGAGAFAPLAGRTLTGISISIQRADGIGTPYDPKPIRVVGHGYTSEPTTEPTIVGSYSVGSLGTEDPLLTFPLPLSVATALQSGALAGLGVSSPSGSDYLAVLGAGTGSGTINITWSA